MRTVLAILSILGASVSNGASFDCTKASDKVEHMICDDVELSKLDDELSVQYKKILTDPHKLNALDITQKQWLNYRNRCETAICIKNNYEDRLFELDFIVRGLKKNKEISRYVTEEELREMRGEPIQDEEKDNETVAGEAFCQIVLGALNNTHPSNYDRPCLADEIFKIPGVSNPEWIPLDIAQHEDLAKKIITLGSVEVNNYLKYPPPEQQQAALNYVKQRNLKAYVLQLPPQFYGDRKLVTLTYRGEFCGKPLSRVGEEHYAAWVTLDLKEIATGPWFFHPKTYRPLMYRGQLYFLQLFGAAEGLRLYIPAKENQGIVCDLSLISE